MSIEREDIGIMEDIDNMNNTPDTLTTNTIEKFALENRVKLNKVRRVCGDDRFTAEQSLGSVRVFGGDEGILTAIKAAATKAEIAVSATELVEKYEGILKKLYGDDTQIEVHTAQHALEKGTIGCGFMEKAINVPNIHEHLSNEDAREIHEAILAGAHKEVVLDGDHAAKSVMLVHSDEWSVNSRSEHEQHFVVDEGSITSYLREITPMFGIYGLNADDVVNQFESQMGKTAEQLAAGLNIYDINFDPQGHPSATFKGIVPSPELQN